MKLYDRHGRQKVSGEALTRQNLGQAAPEANQLTTLYTAPASTTAELTGLAICNRSSVPVKARVAHALAGATDAVEQYLYYDVPVPANRTFEIDLGIVMAATDELRVQAGGSGVSFNLYGRELG